MRKLSYVIAALAAIVAASTWSAPTKAEMYNGPKEVNGKCFHTGQNGFPQGIGYWADCPKPAAATTPRQPQSTSKRHHS